MEFEINFLNNNGYEWFEKQGIAVKGYAFDKNDNYLEKESLANFFLDINNINNFEIAVQSLNGLFSIVISKKKTIFLACDITRTFPIFYFRHKNIWIITDNANYIKSKYNPKFNEKGEKDFLCAGYVTGNQTLLEGIRQVQAAEIIKLEKSEIFSKEYWTYATNKISKNNYQLLQKELVTIYERVVNRLINLVKGKTVVVPLSGGYDSRLILALLIKYGYKNLICFTYGQKNSPEIEIAKKIANKLKIKIEVIEYSNEFFDQQFVKEEFVNYIKYGSNFVSLSHIQDLYAVKYLKLNKLVPKDSIFVPGHTGGLFAGSQLSWNINQNSSNKKVVSEIKKNHFSLNLGYYNNINYYHKDCFGFSNMDSWSWKERQSKFIVNSIRVYEYFGYKSIIPLWDKELTNFFKKVPFKFKNRHYLNRYNLERNLYDFVAFSLFKEFKIDYKKKEKNLKKFIRIILKFSLSNENFLKLKKIINQKQSSNNFEYLVTKVQSHSKSQSLKSPDINGDFANVYINILKDSL